MVPMVATRTGASEATTGAVVAAGAGGGTAVGAAGGATGRAVGVAGGPPQAASTEATVTVSEPASTCRLVSRGPCTPWPRIGSSSGTAVNLPCASFLPRGERRAGAPARQAFPRLDGAGVAAVDDHHLA